MGDPGSPSKQPVWKPFGPVGACSRLTHPVRGPATGGAGHRQGRPPAGPATGRAGRADANWTWRLGCCLFIVRWSGGAAWDQVAADLAGRGYQVGAPDLTGTVSAGPPYCVRQAEMIARSDSGQPVILVGHSGAGPLLAAAGALIDQVRGYIFVDAACRSRAECGWRPCRPIWRPRCGRWLMPRAGCRPGRTGGAMRSWPGSSRIPVCGGSSRPAAPAAAGYVRGGPPAGAAVTRRPRRLPAAKRGLRRPGGPGAGTWLAGCRADQPPSRAAGRARPDRRIAARTDGSASPLAGLPR
jgi:hypothetical protein